MFKGKLFAIICSATSVVVAATTALTLVLSGPRDTQSLHMLSDNDAVAYGVTNYLSGASETIDTISAIVDVIKENPSAFNLDFQINEMADFDEIEGLGGSLDVEMDAKNQMFSLMAGLTVGSATVANGTVYLDEDELIAKIPVLFEGIVTATFDNLSQDLSNSYIGETLLGGFDIDQYLAMFSVASEMMGSYLPEIDFDYADFLDDLMDVISASYFEATDAMSVTNNGKMTLNDGKEYQAYRAHLAVADLSYIILDSIIYILNNEDFQSMIGDVIDYASGMMVDIDEDLEGFDSVMSMAYGSSMGQIFSMASSYVESYWGQIITQLENYLGKTIDFSIYLTDTVEPAAFDLFIGFTENGSLTYDRKNADACEGYFSIKSDMTGGSNVGDYNNTTIEITDYYNTYIVNYDMKSEDNGDFDMNLSFNENENPVAKLKANGSYVEDGDYFNFKMDTLNYVQQGETLFDVTFSVGFNPIDAVSKPSGSPVYNVWDMDLSDFTSLLKEINGNLSDIEDLFQ